MKAPKISKVDIYKINVLMGKQFNLALGVVKGAQNILVRIQADDDIYGLGEGSPLWFITGETQAIAFEAAKDCARLLVSKNPSAIEERMRELDLLLTHNSTVKSAFDMALYDLLAKRAGLPLYALMGGERSDDVITNLTMGIGEPEEMAQSALEYKGAGAHFIKAKLGNNPKEEVVRIQAIRDAIGYEIPIRIDANQAWDYVTAVEVLQRLEPFNIQYCEEPVPHWNNADLKRVGGKSPIPIMADESLFDHHDAFRLASMGACDYFNIKLCKAGGIQGALKIIAVAEAAGIKCQLGSMLETRLGMSANAHLASARPNITFADLDGPMHQTEDPVAGGVIFQGDGRIIIPDTPGHGADIHPDYLKELAGVTILGGRDD